jgi:hypothetical protein
MHPEGSMQLLPEASNKLGSSVINDGLQYAMQTHDAKNIELNVLLSPVEGVHRNEMSRLGKSIDDYPVGVKLAAGERQTHNEIHTESSHFQAGILRGCSNLADLI